MGTADDSVHETSGELTERADDSVGERPGVVRERANASVGEREGVVRDQVDVGALGRKRRAGRAEVISSFEANLLLALDKTATPCCCFYSCHFCCPG